MITDEEIKVQGVQTLIAGMGDVQAEKFIALIQRGHFDYTEWRRGLWNNETLESLSAKAMESRLRQA